MTPSEYLEFLNSLKVGSKVVVYEGCGKPDVLTEVTAVTAKYITVTQHPGIKFDRQTGDDIPTIKGCSTYRRLFPAEESKLVCRARNYKDELIELVKSIEDEGITEDKFHKCYTALEVILNG